MTFILLVIKSRCMAVWNIYAATEIDIKQRNSNTPVGGKGQYMKEKFKKLTERLKNSKGVLVATALCLVAVLLAAGFFSYSSAYAKILPNINAGGLRLGGMTAETAEKEISDAFKNATNGKVVVFVIDGSKADVSFDRLDAVIDGKKTAEAAFSVGRNGGNGKKLLKMLKLAFKGEDIPLEISLNENELDEIIKGLAGDKEVLPEDASFSLDGDRLTVSRGHGGKMVDRQKAIRLLAKAATDPGLKEIELKIETLAAKKVDLDEFYAKITAPMQDAAYRLEDGEVVIDAEKPGITVEKSAVKAALDSENGQNTITVKTQQPKITKKQLEERLFRDVMGSFSSSFATSTEARASNVRLTAQRVNGKILMPGESFSYDKTVGRRTAANGYREAGVYIGNKTETGIGGGICQTSSTLYSAALYANLEIVSRTSHSLPVSYVPAGQDATIAEGYIDLVIKNNTEYPVKFVAEVNGRRLTCKVLGVKEPDISVELVHTRTADYQPQTERTENPEIPVGYKHIINKGAPGYAVASQRIVKQGGKVIKTEKLTRSVYRAAPIEEEVNPADKDTPTEQLKTYTPGMVLEEEKPETTQPQNPEPPQTEPENTELPEPLPESETVSEPANDYVPEEVNV